MRKKNRYWSSTQGNVVAIMVTKSEFLVAKDDMVVALATMSVAVSSPGMAFNILWVCWACRLLKGKGQIDPSFVFLGEGGGHLWLQCLIPAMAWCDGDQHRFTLSCQSGRMVASFFVLMPPGQVVRVRAVARDIVLCFWATHLTLTVPLSTQGRVVQSLIKLTQG